MNIDDIKTITVVGAGDMGHGIAELALIAGYKVFLRDINQKFIDRGVKRINASLEKLVSKGKVTAEHFDKIKAELLIPCIDLEEAVKDTDLVIEAIPEIMDLKKETFKIMDAVAPAHTIFASNTSTMSITQIASATNRPEYEFALKTNKIPVKVNKDVPGFIVNRVQAPGSVLLNCYPDANIAESEAMDAVFRKLGAPMGPYETLDYAGIDVVFDCFAYYAQVIHEDFRPGKTMTARVNAKEFGKKTGKGLFDWSNGRPKIDLSKATDKIDPMDLMAVNANEATKIIAEGACKLEDIDMAVMYGMGAPVGPMASVKDIEPEDLTRRLENLAKKYNKEIFKPTQMIKDGGYQED